LNAPIRVLLADDHGIILDGLRSILQAQPGIEVVGVATNGREAVLEAKRLKPDVVVMDIAMPQLNGIEATDQIMTSLPNARILILSMHSSAEHIYRALQAGAQGYLLKESAGTELVEAVQKVCTGTRYLSRKITETVVDAYIRDRQVSSPLESLSVRERQILQLTVEGHTAADIGATLHLSPKTIETYRSRAMQKLGLSDLPALVKFALQHGLTTAQ
jgi:DNA-binding NarL/FixJ family response regulator